MQQPMGDTQHQAAQCKQASRNYSSGVILCAPCPTQKHQQDSERAAALVKV